MDDFHQHLAEIGLRAAAGFGFALAGGYAVQAHQFLTRPSEDVDLFTAWERRGDFTAAVDAVVAAYRFATIQPDRAPPCHNARIRCGDIRSRPAASAVPITSSIPTHHCG